YRIMVAGRRSSVLTMAELRRRAPEMYADAPNALPALVGYAVSTPLASNDGKRASLYDVVHEFDLPDRRSAMDAVDGPFLRDVLAHPMLDGDSSAVLVG